MCSKRTVMFQGNFQPILSEVKTINECSRNEWEQADKNF